MGMTSFIGFPELDGVLGIPTFSLQQPLADGWQGQLVCHHLRDTALHTGRVHLPGAVQRAAAGRIHVATSRAAAASSAAACTDSRCQEHQQNHRDISLRNALKQNTKIGWRQSQLGSIGLERRNLRHHGAEFASMTAICENGGKVTAQKRWLVRYSSPGGSLCMKVRREA